MPMNPKKILKISLMILLVWFLAHSAFITIDGMSDNGCSGDVAVVMGNKVNEDGSPSKRLKYRLTCGLNLYNMHRVKYIMVTGGLGKEGFYEGSKMRDFLLTNHVPDSAIIVDNMGDNTRKSVENFTKIAKRRRFQSAIVVSQFYHITRSKMLFKRYGFKNICGAAPQYFELRDFYSVFREFFAFYFS
jgi:vancomycin permeability regulator SanA